MKAPEYGTDVFAASAGSSSGLLTFDTNFRVDFNWLKGYTTTSVWYVNTRLTGERYIGFDGSNQESSLGINWDRMTGWQHTSSGDYTAYFGWSFKRAAKFLDIVTYTGSSSTYLYNHNLGAVPELMIVKNRTANESGWSVYTATTGADYRLQLNSTSGSSATSDWDNASDVGTAPTATQFNVKAASAIVNSASHNYIAYLFASVDGVSKVGSYTGTGSDLNVDCGFSSGARFVLIKRTDTSGPWIVFDSVRGIVAGNDPYILLNSTAAQVTGNDLIDPLSSGFTVLGAAGASLNASGGTYIFLAIA